MFAFFFNWIYQVSKGPRSSSQFWEPIWKGLAREHSSWYGPGHTTASPIWKVTSLMEGSALWGSGEEGSSRAQPGIFSQINPVSRVWQMSSWLALHPHFRRSSGGVAWRLDTERHWVSLSQTKGSTVLPGNKTLSVLYSGQKDLLFEDWIQKLMG